MSTVQYLSVSGPDTLTTDAATVAHMTRDFEQLIQQKPGSMKTFEGWGESCAITTMMSILLIMTVCCTDSQIYNLLSQITDHSSAIPTSSTELTPSQRLFQCSPPLWDLILDPLPQGPTHCHLRGAVFTLVPQYSLLPGHMALHIPGGSAPHHQLNFHHLDPLTINL